jgi:hypothetical protein
MDAVAGGSIMILPTHVAFAFAFASVLYLIHAANR